MDARKRWDGGKTHWGTGVPRYRTSAANWKQPLAWNRKAEKDGLPHRVFCASLADVFDNEIPWGWRYELWNLIRATSHLSWFIVTKRIGNAKAMLPRDWCEGYYGHVRILITVCNQEEADRDVPKLLALPCKNGLSMEPLLEYIDLSKWLIGGTVNDEQRNGIHGVPGNRGVLCGRERKDLASSKIDSRKPRRDTAVLEGGKQATGGAVEIGRISDGDVFGREDAPQGFRAPHRVDDAEASGYSGRNGDKSRERKERGHEAEKSDVDDAVAERASRLASLRPKTCESERREESSSAAKGKSGLGHSEIERDDGPIATGENVCSQTGHNIGHSDTENVGARSIGWVIIGGESGPKARPFYLEWARSTVTQCKAAGVPVFVKQLGANPLVQDATCPLERAIREGGYVLKDRSGADPSEWPEDLRVREWPL